MSNNKYSGDICLRYICIKPKQFTDTLSESNDRFGLKQL